MADSSDKDFPIKDSSDKDFPISACPYSVFSYAQSLL